MTHPWQLYHWHFEISGKCTLKCPRCPRNEAVAVPWHNKEIDLTLFSRILSPDLLRDHVKRITMCGDIGDPIYASQFIEIIRYIKQNNPRIHVFTITNGSYRNADWWRSLATVSNEFDTVNFSVDGYDHASNNLYRINSDWASIMQGMEIMCNESQSFVNWAAIAFRFNQDHFPRMIGMAQDLGCDGFQLTRSTKFGSKYGEAYGGAQDHLEPRMDLVAAGHRYEREYLPLTKRRQPIDDYLAHNQHMFETVKQQHDQFITPMCSIGNRGLYVSADGVLHPCSWVSFPYTSMSTSRKTIWFQNSFHQIYREKLDLKLHSLEDVMSDPVWHKLFGSFDDPDKAWVECEQKCHRSVVDTQYAVGYWTN